MFATVRVYEMSSDWDDELVKHLDEGFLPEVRRVPGFVAYYTIQAGPRVFASVTVCEDRAGAEESNKVASRYVMDHLADRFPSWPEITLGEVPAHATT